jgi:hypothetical protein
MSNCTSTRVVCRLLGGSGRAPLQVVPVDKTPALLRPSSRSSADVVVLPAEALPLAALMSSRPRRKNSFKASSGCASGVGRCAVTSCEWFA